MYALDLMRYINEKNSAKELSDLRQKLELSESAMTDLHNQIVRAKKQEEYANEQLKITTSEYQKYKDTMDERWNRLKSEFLDNFEVSELVHKPLIRQ
jgi:predicted nuclease with TOPRIM domain